MDFMDLGYQILVVIDLVGFSTSAIGLETWSEDPGMDEIEVALGL